MSYSLKDRALDRNLPLIITLDGPAASGKGAIGLLLANRFNLDYFQSGILYRNLAFLCIKNAIDLDDLDSISALSKDETLVFPASKELNNETIADLASKIAEIKAVRANLNQQQMNLIAKTNRIIMEGRDIGTIIAPGAHLKLFIEASPEIRIERRYKQLREEGKDCIISEISGNLLKRDQRDKERSLAPLVPAKDAFIIDTSHLSKEEVLEVIENFIFNKST